MRARAPPSAFLQSIGMCCADALALAAAATAAKLPPPSTPPR
jgi:hypothetical protein